MNLTDQIFKDVPEQLWAGLREQIEAIVVQRITFYLDRDPEPNEVQAGIDHRYDPIKKHVLFKFRGDPLLGLDISDPKAVSVITPWQVNYGYPEPLPTTAKEMGEAVAVKNVRFLEEAMIHFFGYVQPDEKWEQYLVEHPLSDNSNLYIYDAQPLLEYDLTDPFRPKWTMYLKPTQLAN
jgi:hypothetical protein